jgi:hypothetical protein
LGALHLGGIIVKLPENTEALLQALRAGLVEALGGKLYAIHVYGAIAFPDSTATGDLDFYAILHGPLTEQERAAIGRLYDRLGREYPPLGADLDGRFILLSDARGAPFPPLQVHPEVIDASWPLHRAHLLAGRCIVLHGPTPQKVYLPPTWPELERALWSEIEYVEANLDRYPDYCILNLCRLIYSLETRDVVVSKAGAAAWARAMLPQWQDLIDLAARSYAGGATPQDRPTMVTGAGELYRLARERAGGSRKGDQQPPAVQVRVSLGTHVEVELITASGESEPLAFDLVADSQANFGAGFLGESTPLARAIAGQVAGSRVPYRAADIVEVKIVSVAPAVAPPPGDAAADREAVIRKAVAKSNLADTLQLALTVDVKWGDYDPDGLQTDLEE